MLTWYMLLTFYMSFEKVGMSAKYITSPHLVLSVTQVTYISPYLVLSFTQATYISLCLVISVMLTQAM